LRDFIVIDDVADHLLLLVTHQKAAGINNGGSGKPQSLREIVEARISALVSSIHPILGTYADRTYKPLAFWADMTRLSKLK